MKYTDIDKMPLVLEVSDIADTLGIGINKAYSLVNSGTIPSLKLGQKYRIPKEHFINFLKNGVMKVN